MKKSFGALFICLLMLLALPGCGRTDLTAPTDQQPEESQSAAPSDTHSGGGGIGMGSSISGGAPETEATETEEPSQEPVSSSGDGCEAEIRQALHSSETSVFEIQSDFEFSNTAGVHTYGTYGNTDSSDMEDKEAVGRLVFFLGHKSIRVSEDGVSMDDSDYSCTITELSDDQGLGISIKRGGSTDVTQGEFQGTIKGDTMAGNAYISTTTYVNNSGNGAGAGGDISVSIKKLDKDEWPPVPVTDITVTVNDDNSVTVTWNDPNPAGLVKSYDIYRITDNIYDEAKPIANVTDTSFTDDSDTAKTEDLILAYSVVAVGANGDQSEFSPYVDANVLFR